MSVSAPVPSIGGGPAASDPKPWDVKGCPKTCFIDRNVGGGAVQPQNDVVISSPGKMYMCLVNDINSNKFGMCAGVLRYTPTMVDLFNNKQAKCGGAVPDKRCLLVNNMCSSLGAPGISSECRALHDIHGTWPWEGTPCGCATPKAAPTPPPPSKPPTAPPPTARLPPTPFCPPTGPPTIRPPVPSGRPPIPPGASDEDVCKLEGIYVTSHCDNNCKSTEVCKEQGVDAPGRRVRCYNCIAAKPKVVVPEGIKIPEVKREKPVLYPFGGVDECKRVKGFSKFEQGGEECKNTCPGDMDCRVVDVCAGGRPTCPPENPKCVRGEKLCMGGSWLTCFTCERKMELLEVRIIQEKKVEVGEVKVERKEFKAEIPQEVIGICNAASKQYGEIFDSKISPPKPEGCDSGCKQVKFNTPLGAAKCCCCGPCKPVKAPTAPPVPEQRRPSPEQVCKQVGERAAAEGKQIRVELPKEGAECGEGCKLQDFKLALCCLCVDQS